jgi:hypothetical protein
MASYSSYKRVDGAQIDAGTVADSKIAFSALQSWSVVWFHGAPEAVSGGCCCLWTVPANVRRLFIEAWGSGGNGHGACVNNRCQHYKGAGGGYYNSKTINTAPGCQYTVCAAGVFPCCSTECTACTGCSSYVNGFNLSGFCAIGGTSGCANASWNDGCFSQWDCCVGPTSNGGDFGMGNHSGTFFGHPSYCHCHCFGTIPTAAPFIGTNATNHIHECWMRCGCWTVPYGHGALGAMSTYCGTTCCGQGGTGGPGLVKISFI